MVQFPSLMQYELVIVSDVKGDAKVVEKKLTELVEKEGFAVTEASMWGRRKLTYPLKKQTEGLYYSSTISSKTAKPHALLTKMKMDETILRVLVLKKELVKELRNKKPVVATEAVVKN